jgi:hypothetical protein
MKKLILSTTFLIAGTFGVLAQGLMDLSNAPWEAWPDTTPVDRLVYVGSIAPGNAVADPAWTAALFQNVGGNWQQLGDAVAFFGPGLEGIFATDGVQRNVTASGAAGAKNVQIRIFNAAGVEQPPSVAGANEFSFVQGASIPPSPTDTLLVNMRAFAVVPEPSTVALGVLGLGALLLFRRRK